MTVHPTREGLERCLEGAGDAPLLVVGDVMLDRYLAGSVDRISPEAPVPVVRLRKVRSAPGGAANVAAGVAALGAFVEVFGVVGEDAPARVLEERLARRPRIRAHLFPEAGRPTTTKVRVVAEHQQMLRIDRERDRPLEPATETRLREAALERLGSARALVLQDYDKGVLSTGLVSDLIGAAGERGVPVIVDPKLRRFFEYGGADVFKPNAREAAAALGEEELDVDAAALRGLARRAGCRHLLVTLGPDGMCLLEDGSDGPVRIPARTQDVYDVSGAGDTVTAVLAVALAGGLAVAEAAWLANVAAGLAVTRFGARPVGRGALRRELGRALGERRGDDAPRRNESERSRA